MHSVQTPARLGRRTRLVGAALALALVAAAVTLALASGGGARGHGAAVAPAKDLPPPGAVALIGGMKLQSARCKNWVGAPRSEKLAVADALKRMVGGMTQFGRASSLTRAQAFALFDRVCSQSFTRGFLLYELYTRSAGFGGTTAQGRE